MTLTPGTRLGPYEIAAHIGSGGMGEVYRARDTNLGRQVAIKILPDLFARDPERLARFDREAKTLAGLNHPNIAQVYGFAAYATDAASAARDGGRDARALVMELVEGLDLARRIAQGSIPLDEVLAIARQIAEALEAAHEQGIVHRDLKPANAVIRADGTVKVLDFGLAKALDPFDGPSGDPAAAVSLSPTITALGGTAHGVVLGTAPYMSPEQARGQRVDARTDVWAFGCVVYEMLTGARAFDGSAPADAMAAVLKLEPDWSRIPAGTPPALTRLVQKCLAKDRRKRLQAIGDARLELEDIGIAPTGPSPAAAASRRRKRTWMAIAGAAVLAALALAAASLRVPAVSSAEPIRASVPLPAGLELDGSGPPELALSPDGRTLAFLARSADGYQRLYVRRLDDDQAVVVPESETAEGPFFSPDGRWVAFAVGVSVSGIEPPELRKYSLDTKLTQTVASLQDYFGGYFTDDDSIVFVGTQPRGLYTVPSGGGAPAELVGRVRFAGKDEARTLAWPDPLPGGEAVLITDWGGASTLGHVAVLDLATRELTSLGLEGAGARFVPGGFIVYGSRDASLMAVPFDPATRRTTGTPVALMPGIAYGRNNVPAFAFSPSGTFVYATGYLRWSRREPMRMIRVTASGALTALPFEPQLFRRGFALSPGGDAIAAGTWDDARWIFDLGRRTRARLPAGGTLEAARIAWSPDGTQLALSGPVVGRSAWGAFAQPSDGAGEVVVLGKALEGEIHVAGWLPDNVHVVAFTHTAATSGVTFRRIGPGGSDEVLFHEEGNVGSARPSPDGRWLAYDSTATGDFEVYVTGLGAPRRRVTVSRDAGSRNPVWSPDGRTLYYLRDRDVLAVSIEPLGDGLRIGSERRLFEWNVDANREYVVGPDGAFYAVDVVPDAPKQALIHLRTRWFDEVERLVGAR